MSDPSQSEITQILFRLQEGQIDRRAAADRIFDAAYAELRRLASGLMRTERADHSLRPTALVHEAYIRLADDSKIDWRSRAHFFGVAARAMRQVLVDHARARTAARRGGGWKRITLDPALALSSARDVSLLRIDDMLIQLTEKDERMARIVELRIFGGMSSEEVAHVLDVSPRTVRNEWSVAKMWFTRGLAESEL